MQMNSSCVPHTELRKHLPSALPCLPRRLFVCAGQIQRALLRNNQTQRFSQKQALRLHQGLVTSTAEQVRAREADAIRNVSLLTAISPRTGDGASVRAGAAAGLHSEKLRGRGGGPDGQTDPQRSPRLQSRKCDGPESCSPFLMTFLVTAALLAHINC